MFRVLNNLPRTTSGVQPVAQMNYLVNEVRRNLQTVQTHYQNFIFSVPSDHILNLLLAQLPMRFDISVQSYYDRLVDGTAELANRVKLTTTRYAGKLFDGAIYPGLQECLIAHSSSRLLTRDLMDNWRSWSPLTVVTHPFSSLRYVPLHTKRVEEGNGIAVIYVDVPLLALQYRMWALSMGYVEDGVFTVKNPVTTFLASFPLVNALWSHNDVVLRNRCLWVPPTTVNDKGVLALSNQNSLFDQVSLAVQATLLKRPRSYSDMLRQMPSLFGDQFVSTHRAFEVDLRQTRWARDLGCLTLWQQLVSLNQVSASTDFNSQVNGDLLRAADRSIKEGNWAMAPLSNELRKEVESRVSEIVTTLG